MTELVAEALLSGVFNLLIERLASPEVLTFLRGQKNDGILEKLWLKLLGLQAVLDDAESQQFTEPAVKRWLDELKHVVYQADDLLDKINYQVLRCKVEAEYQKDTNDQVRDSTSTPANSFDPEIESKLKEITDMLDDFLEQKDVLGLTKVGGRNWSGSIPSTSLVDESSVHGGGNDKEGIIKLLLSDDASDTAIGVIPIVGMGGMGQTTLAHLAQLVYNDSRVNKHFEMKAWECVSDEFNIAGVIRSILDNLAESPCNITDLGRLQVSLKKRLNGKKVLIVLDDVWNENNICWENLRKPLIGGAPGSKIIVPTRNPSVADIMRTVPMHNWQPLSDEHCWSLFARIAFRNGDSSDYPELEKIGRKIVKKCNGLPLAAETLGGMLCSKLDVEEWKNILESKIWDLPQDKNIILPALRLSYDYLSSQSKQCFAYCSVFPKGYKFRRERIVQIWIVQNFMQQPKGNKTMEKSGDEIFQELVSRSFLQQSSENESYFVFLQQSSENESYFVMDDLVHDLAQYVAGQFSLSLKDKRQLDVSEEVYLRKLRDISEKVRHVFCDNCANIEIDILEACNGFKCLRSFIPSYFWWDSKSMKSWEDIFSTMSCLRVLVFPFYNTSEFSNWISNMIHLRYLDLSRSGFVELPEAVCNLHILQTLLLKRCDRLHKLPTNIGKLSCLRHLYNSGTPLIEMPRQMTRLSGLQHLTYFVVGEQSGLGINGLQGFDQLEGKLTISNLHNVMRKEDALDAKLKEKKLLRKLKLEWGNEEHDDSQNEKGVLENLEPPKNLEKLVIINYGGTTFPDWLGDYSFSNISRLSLENCRHCILLPPLGQLPSLRELAIEKMESIEKVGLEFYGSGDNPFQSLKKLCFKHMKNWEEWSPISGADEFSQLEILRIEDCPELIGSLPDRFPSLVELEIRDCPKLQSVELESFPEGCLPSNLSSIRIHGCRKLKALPKQMSALQSLQSLRIESCSEIQSFPLLPSTLRSLRIIGLPNLKSLGSLHLLVSLQDLWIGDCSKLESLPEDGLPPSLYQLIILRCPLLEPHLQRDIGDEWHKIAHIRDIRVG